MIQREVGDAFRLIVALLLELNRRTPTIARRSARHDGCTTPGMTTKKIADAAKELIDKAEALVEKGVHRAEETAEKAKHGAAEVATKVVQATKETEQKLAHAAVEAVHKIDNRVQEVSKKKTDESKN
jgi:methyl-accepting chemotaxis protein